MFSFLKNRKKKKPSDLTAAPEKQVAEAQKAQVPRPGRTPAEEKKPDSYCMKLANHARAWRYAVTAVLLVFAVAMTFFYSDEITAENFGLLLRNASFSFPGEKRAFETVRYDADLQMDFAAYGEYFAVATTAGLRLYDHRGNIVFDKSFSMKCPRIETGKKYIMVYDKEGKSSLVCNSVTALREEDSEGVLYDADMSDRGNYVFLSSSARYLSVITVYNRSFNKERELMIDRYPLKVRVSENADRMLFLSYKSGEDGAVEGHVSIYRLSETTELLADHVYDGLPLAGWLTEKGAAVILKDRAVFYDEEGKEAESVSFGKRAPVLGGFSEKMLVVSFEENRVLGENLFWCIDPESGKVMREFPYKGRVKKLWISEELLCIGEKEELFCVSMDTWETLKLKMALPENLFFGEEDALFACYGNKAENIYAQIASLRKTKEETAGEESPS